MASISRQPNGRKVIQFYASDGKRRTIRLGKVSEKLAGEIKVKVETIQAAQGACLPIDTETAVWLSKIGEALAGKLSAVGLVPSRGSQALGEFLDSYMAGRPDVKTGTNYNYVIARDRLVEFFGRDRNLRDFNEGDADAWLVHLRTKYAPATIGRTVRHAQQFFRAALRRRLVSANPFADVKAPSQVNTARSFYVTQDMAAKVLEACPDAEWRLLFALSRYGGQRCPSEHLSLRWSDVDWERDRLRVRSPKKEHLEDGGERLVPLFPELRTHLEEAFELAANGEQFVISRRRQEARVNLRTQLHRIIRKAGLTPWPRTFQNLRASRETELAQTFPLHVVCQWIGNTAKVAADHYLQVTEADFERAAKSGALALQNAVQQPAPPSRTESQESSQVLTHCESSRNAASPCDYGQYVQTTRPGFEPGQREPKSLVLPLHYRVRSSVMRSPCVGHTQRFAGLTAGDLGLAFLQKPLQAPQVETQPANSGS